MAAERVEDVDPASEIECEIDDLIADHGSERAAIRALLQDMTALMTDADRSVSRGYLRACSRIAPGPRTLTTNREESD